jgi:hypothetical protein
VECRVLNWSRSDDGVEEFNLIVANRSLEYVDMCTLGVERSIRRIDAFSV